MSANNSFLVFSGSKSRYLAEKICQSLGCPLGNSVITRFSDGEFAVSYEESIRGRDVFLVQSTFPNSDNLMELLLMIDAAKRASARTINAVIPYFGWARQDRKDKPRVSIGAKLVADLLSVTIFTHRVSFCPICSRSTLTTSALHRPTWVAQSVPTHTLSTLAVRWCSATRPVHVPMSLRVCRLSAT